MYQLNVIKLEIPNKDIIVEDVKTRWNSTY